MSPVVSVSLTAAAREDLLGRYDFLLERDIDAADRAWAVISDAMKLLERFPFSCRKAGGGSHGPLVRELVIPFGSGGYVALFEIDHAASVTVLAVRHQREQVYH